MPWNGPSDARSHAAAVPHNELREALLAAIDRVALAGLADGEAEAWADGFRQGWLAAREAVDREFAALAKASKQT